MTDNDDRKFWDDAEIMSAAECNTLTNRLFEMQSSREHRPMEDVLGRYEPTVQDVTRLLKTVSDLRRFKARDEREWHEEMFRKLHADFYRDESQLLNAFLVSHGASWMASLVDEVLSKSDQGASMEIPENLIANLRSALDSYNRAVESDMALPEATFIERLKALIADEEVRQGASTGESVSDRYRRNVDPS